MRRLLVLVCLLVIVAAGTAVALEGSTTVCQVCGEHDRRFVDEELRGTTGSSTLTVELRRSGSARFVARTPINESAARYYRSNPQALNADVASMVEDVRHRTPENVSARVEDGAVVIAYDAPGTVQRGVGGVLVFDGFHGHGDYRGYELWAERVTVIAPDGETVTNRPAKAAVDGDTATWSQETAGGLEFPESAYVAVAPRGGLVATVSTTASLALVSAPYVLWDVLGYAAVGATVLAAVIVGLFEWRRLRGQGSRERAATPLAWFVGGFVVVLSVIAAEGGDLLLPTLGVISGGSIVVAAWWGSNELPVGDGVPLRERHAWGLYAVPILLGATGGVTVPAIDLGRALSLSVGAFAVPMGYLALGMVAERSGPGRYVRVVPILLAPVALVGPIVENLHGGFVEVGFHVVVALWALLVSAVGTLLWSVGGTAAAEHGIDDGGDR